MTPGEVFDLLPGLKKASVRWVVARRAYARALTRARGKGEWEQDLGNATQALLEAEQELERQINKLTP